MKEEKIRVYGMLAAIIWLATGLTDAHINTHMLTARCSESKDYMILAVKGGRPKTHPSLAVLHDS